MSLEAGLPDDFVWGVATAAYQIEGSPDADGKGESIWDRFARTPGTTHDDTNADVACDHYNRWQTDISLLRELNVQAYRFSISWPRIVPDGSGPVNPSGLDFYDKLVDGLLDAGIEPSPTLYHWDLPQALEDAGGWINRETAYRYADYAAKVVERLGDRVKHWWTINEPWCIAELGYRFGDHAPGRREPERWFAAAHHVLLAHGLGMEAVRAASTRIQAGIASNVEASVPRSRHPADIAAAALHDDMRNNWYLDPLFYGSYPQNALDRYGWQQSEVHAGDMEIISAPMDHLGVNYYSRQVVADRAIADTDRPQPLITADLPRTTMGWEVYPEGLRDVLVDIRRRYEPAAIYVSENGVAFPDQLVGGAVHDEGRRDYLHRHFSAAGAAAAAGVPLRGFFIWSLMDNFEWQHGFSQRFGLAWTDYDTQERVIKDSGRWFADFVASQR